MVSTNFGWSSQVTKPRSSTEPFLVSPRSCPRSSQLATLLLPQFERVFDHLRLSRDQTRRETVTMASAREYEVVVLGATGMYAALVLRSAIVMYV